MSIIFVIAAVFVDAGVYFYLSTICAVWCEGRHILPANILIWIAASYNVVVSIRSLIGPSFAWRMGLVYFTLVLFVPNMHGLVISAQQCVVYFEITTHIGDLPVCYLIFVAASFVEEWPCQLTSYVEVKLIFACTVRYPAVSRSSRYLQTTRPTIWKSPHRDSTVYWSPLCYPVTWSEEWDMHVQSMRPNQNVLLQAGRRTVCVLSPRPLDDCWAWTC